MFGELNSEYLTDLNCTQMLKDDADKAAVAAGVINKLQFRENLMSTPEQQALVDSYAATIKYLQEHIRQLSDIILKLTTAK